MRLGAASIPIRPVTADWKVMKASVEAVLDRLEKRHRGTHPEDAYIATYIAEIRELGHSIERKVRQEAEVFTALFFLNPRPGISPRVMADRIQTISEARLTVVYGYLIPQSLNEWYSNPSADFPIKLWTTVENYCRDYRPASREVNTIVDSIDPNIRPKIPGPGLCD